jgi:putative inorganic carbon (hco3(-)) transporter
MGRTVPLRALPAAVFGGALLGALALHVATTPSLANQVSFPRAAVAVAAAAGAYLALRVDLAWTFSAGIAMAVFSGNYQHAGLPVPPDRALLAFGLVLLWWRSRPTYRERHPELAASSAPRSGVTEWLLVAAGAYAVVSAAWAGTLLEHDGAYGLLDRFGLVPFAVFLLAPRIYSTERARNALLTTMVILGAYLGTTALAEGLGLDALVFPSYILDPTIGIHFNRARGPFLEAVANGLALFACGVAAAVAIARWRDPILRVVAAAVICLCAVGIVLTLTRAVWLASIVAPVVALALVPAMRRWLPLVVLIGAVVAVGAFQLIPGLHQKADDRAQDERPVWDRLNTDAAAIEMIGHRPLLGFGWNSFVQHGPEYLRQKGDYPLTGAGLNVHNVFLSHAVELGLVGFVLWLVAFLAGIGWAALRGTIPALEPWRIGLVALAVHWIVVANFGPLGYAFPTLLLWTWAGVVRASPVGRNSLTPR